MSCEHFLERLSLLLEHDPYFLPAYLEHLLRAKERGDVVLERQLRTSTKQAIARLFEDRSARASIQTHWTPLELALVNELFIYLIKQERVWSERVVLRSQKYVFESFLNFKTTTSPSSDTFLRCITTITPDTIREEVTSAHPGWWNIATDRSKIDHHQHTHSIALRGRADEISPVDGHESFVTDAVQRFPKTHQAILDFASQHNLRLGRVAIVRLAPGHQAYRHYDSEPHLVGRNRYHLVVSSGKNNILSSGTDLVRAKPGEIWFFDNKVMHRAFNDSTIPRIHVIFDGLQT